MFQTNHGASPAEHPEDEQKLGGVPSHLQAAVQQLVGQPPAPGNPTAKAGATNDGGDSPSDSADRARGEED